MKKILIAEDDKFLIKAYAAKIGKMKFETILAVNGEEAINQAKAHHPDLILLDIMMPIKDGFQVLAALKKDNKTKGIPVIMLSNLGQEEDVSQAMKLGAKDYMIKSNTSMKELAEKVKTFLEK